MQLQKFSPVAVPGSVDKIYTASLVKARGISSSTSMLNELSNVLPSVTYLGEDIFTLATENMKNTLY